MVKLLVLSDLHVEFAAFEPDPVAVAAADVVVLAGDIHRGTQGLAWARSAFPDKPIVYVAGNHEFYGHDWTETLEELRHAAKLHGIHFLENDAVEIEGVRFLGCSLWTDFELFGIERKSEVMRAASDVMNDFKVIKVKKTPDTYWIRGRRLVPGLTVSRHRRSVEWLEQALAGATLSTTVVVTHHAPHARSVAPRFAEDPLTPAFASDLSRLMGGAGLWVHGHMHDSADYLVGSTRVVCNPRGYPLRTGSFENGAFKPGLIVRS
jgi:Icc-related predicted phosphoesterase